MIDAIILLITITIGVYIRLKNNHFPADDSDSNQGRRQ